MRVEEDDGWACLSSAPTHDDEAFMNGAPETPETNGGYLEDAHCIASTSSEWAVTYVSVSK